MFTLFTLWLAIANVMPPKTQKIVEKQQSQGKSLYVFLVSRIFIGGILFRIVISVSCSELFPLSSPDGIDGKGPSGAPANLNVFISEFCCAVSGMGCRIFKGEIQKLKIYHWILRIGVVASCQKLGIILVIKWFKNWCYQICRYQNLCF